MSKHALIPGRSPRFFAAVVLTVVATASPARATSPTVDPGPAHPSEHNARVAEYLLLQYLASEERNARVAERMDERRTAGTSRSHSASS